MNISDAISGTVLPPAAVSGAKEPVKAQRSEEAKPVTDEYVPEEKQEPVGRYWIGKDEDNNPKIYFDAPEQAAAPPKADGSDKEGGASGSERMPSGEKAESCTCNTDKVDREIEKLKKKQEELKRQFRSETDETKAKELKQKLTQVEAELNQKDNDAYRRQHSVFS